MGRSERGLLSCSELRGGSICLCRLGTACLAPVSKFNYVLAQIGFIGSRKLSCFDDH
jgi:hypothetical protein